MAPNTARSFKTPKARIRGDVHYCTLEMASGAEVNGQMKHESEKKLLEHQKEPAKPVQQQQEISSSPKVAEIKPAASQ